MWSVVVVVVSELLRDGTDFVDTFKDVWVKDLGAIGAVKALDIRVLRRFPRLDVLQRDVMAFGPFLHRLTDEFRAIIHPAHLWGSTLFDESVQDLHNPACGKARIHLDAQRLAVEVVKHVKGAEPASRPKCITHEIHRPRVIDVIRHVERILHACRDALLSLPFQVQL